MPATTTWTEFPRLWVVLLDQVWAFLRSDAALGLWTHGHNIMLYQDELFAGVVGFQATTPLGGQGIYRRAVTLDATDGRVAVIGGFGIGAPIAAIVLEELLAVGVSRFLSIGTAGGLQPDVHWCKSG